MSFDIKYPQISATSDRGQLEQIRAYLYTLADQLKWALNSISSGETKVVQQSSKGSTKETETEAQATFNSIKSLIIRSADIVESYYQEINEKLIGQYVAQSEFGRYEENTEQKITTNSKGVERAFSDIQKIISDIEGLEHSLIEVNAHTKAGLLYYDDNGVPIYGFEIGQKNTIDGKEVFNKYARFTSDRLSFYDQNNTEVAYISDYKLYITNAQITGTLNLGRYEIDTSNGLAFKWV